MPDAHPPTDIGEHTPVVTVVDRPDDLTSALAGLGAGAVGVDVERADADNYFRRAALVQVGVAGRCVLVDSVALDDLGALDAFLADRLVVLHALENDVEPLARAGVRPVQVADTAVAAALLGLPTGLGPLLEELLDLRLPGDKQAFQRADWAQRPLPDDMVGYAAGDVVHLPALWRELSARLDAAGRAGWYEQELTAVRAQADADSRDWTRVKGSARLSPQQRAIVRSLWEARERIARRHDLAPNRLLRDEVIRDVAVDLPGSREDLVRRSRRRRRLVRAHVDELFGAVEQGRLADPEPHGRSGRRWTEADRDAYDRVRRARADVAADLGIDAGVLCPGRPLQAAVATDPASGRELCQAAGLRPWQVELLAEPLWDAYQQARH